MQERVFQAPSGRIVHIREVGDHCELRYSSEAEWAPLSYPFSDACNYALDSHYLEIKQGETPQPTGVRARAALEFLQEKDESATPTTHKCRCDMTTLLRTGCACGGV